VARLPSSASMWRDVIQLVVSVFWFAGVAFGSAGMPVALRLLIGVLSGVLAVAAAAGLIRHAGLRRDHGGVPVGEQPTRDHRLQSADRDRFQPQRGPGGYVR
jgi:hypothetical protein